MKYPLMSTITWTLPRVEALCRPMAGLELAVAGGGGTHDGVVGHRLAGRPVHVGDQRDHVAVAREGAEVPAGGPAGDGEVAGDRRRLGRKLVREAGGEVVGIPEVEDEELAGTALRGEGSAAVGPGVEVALRRDRVERERPADRQRGRGGRPVRWPGPPCGGPGSAGPRQARPPRRPRRPPAPSRRRRQPSPPPCRPRPRAGSAAWSDPGRLPLVPCCAGRWAWGTSSSAPPCRNARTQPLLRRTGNPREHRFDHKPTMGGHARPGGATRCRPPGG